MLPARPDRRLLTVYHKRPYDTPMPTSNPRVNVTLKPSTAAILKRMSQLTGNSQSGLIAELLEANEDTFQRLVTVLEAAHMAKESLTEEMRSGLQEAQGKLETQLGLVLETLDEGTAPILAAAEKVRRRAARKTGGGARSPGRSRGLEGGSTPISNRGVRNDPKQAKKPTRTRT